MRIDYNTETKPMGKEIASGCCEIVILDYSFVMSSHEDISEDFQTARDEFIGQWGAMSSSWGISRTMAQIHALLLVSPKPLYTDQIMEELQISRGNAHGNLKELVNWGIVKSVCVKGDRKEYFEAVKDIWAMFCIISRERKRREIEPALAVLKNCEEKTAGIECADCVEFNRQMKNLGDFVVMISSLMDKLSCSDQSKAIPMALKLLS
jgi:DNA-binding transcriptional regulator GbsR (MarR family)